MERTQLVRDVMREALFRMEESARTVKDFRRIVMLWNRLDSNRERKERRNEISRPTIEMLHWDQEDESHGKGKLKSEFDTVFPSPYYHYWWRLLLKGELTDLIHDCPFQMHEFVCDKKISRLIEILSENHKEVLYYSAIRQLNNVSIAEIRNQTDRNIRKILALIIKRLQEKLAPIIKEEIENGNPDVTLEKRRFIKRYYKDTVDIKNSK